MGQQKHGIRSGDRLQITDNTRPELPGRSKLIQLTKQESGTALDSNQIPTVSVGAPCSPPEPNPRGQSGTPPQEPSTWSKWPGATQHLPMPTLRATGVLTKGSALQGPGHFQGCSWFKCPQKYVTTCRSGHPVEWWLWWTQGLGGGGGGGGGGMNGDPGARTGTGTRE